MARPQNSSTRRPAITITEFVPHDSLEGYVEYIEEGDAVVPYMLTVDLDGAVLARILGVQGRTLSRMTADEVRRGIAQAPQGESGWGYIVRHLEPHLARMVRDDLDDIGVDGDDFDVTVDTAEIQDLATVTWRPVKAPPLTDLQSAEVFFDVDVSITR